MLWCGIFVIVCLSLFSYQTVINGDDMLFGFASQLKLIQSTTVGCHVSRQNRRLGYTTLSAALLSVCFGSYKIIFYLCDYKSQKLLDFFQFYA